MSPNNSKDETALVVQLQKSDLPAEVRAEMQAEIEQTQQEMLDNIDLRPPQIKIAGGGANNFTFGDDGESRRKFKGLILAVVKANAYWHKVTNAKGDPIVPLIQPVLSKETDLNIPICKSIGGIIGSRPKELLEADGENVSCFGNCRECFLNQYGTALDDSGNRGKGKACKNGRRLILIPEGESMPHTFMIPPTSIKAFDSYVTALASKKMVIWQIWTQFSLHVVDGGGQIKYSVIDLEVADPLPINEIQAVYEFRKQYKDLTGLDITKDEMVYEDKPVETEAEVVDDAGNITGDDIPF